MGRLEQWRRWPAGGTRAAFVLGSGGVALAWLAPLAVFVFSSRFLIGYDAYFHLQLAEVMTERGIFLQEFPWATESMWADTWFDKEWLFHVLLIPFLFLGKVAGGKALIVFGNLLIIACSWYCLRSLRVSRPQTFFWMAVLPWSCWGVFWVRLSICRPHLLGLAILLLAIGAMAARRHLILGVASSLYALSHTGHWQLLGLALILDLFRTFFDEEGRRREWGLRGCPLSVPVLVGTVCGELLHPHFPANIEGLYVQNVLVVLDSWSGEWAWMRPEEFKPAGYKIFKLSGPFFVGLAWVLIRGFGSKLRGSCDLYALATYCLLYLLLAVNNFRFLEYSTPIGVVFLAAFFSKNSWRDISDRYRPQLRAAIIASAALAFIFSVHGYLHYYRSYNVVWKAQRGNDHIYADAASWLRRSLAPGEIVFTDSWSDNAVLWFQAPDQRYMLFLDPMFMRYRSPEKFAIWKEIAFGTRLDPGSDIRKLFHSRVAFVSDGNSILAQRLDRAGYLKVFTGKTGEVIYLLSERPLPQQPSAAPSSSVAPPRAGD